MRAIAIYILFTFLLLLNACTNKKPYYSESGRLMGNEYTLHYQADKRLTYSIDSLLEHCNNSVNLYNSKSIVAQVNLNKDVRVDEWFTDVFNKGVELSEMTNGIFDATCLPLVRFWLNGGFTDWDEGTEQKVDSILQFVGYNKVRIEDNKVVKDDPRTTMTLTAMVKGYTCDKIADLLEKNGVRNYMLNIGGAVVARGVDKEGAPWQKGIRRPEETPDNRTVNMEEIVLIQGNEKEALATSGDFLRFYEKNGKKYAYTVNPITGYPSEQNILSSTILAPDGATSEGLSTAFTIMGLDEAVQIAEALPGIEYFFIYSDEQGRLQVKSSKGMTKHLMKK